MKDKIFNKYNLIKAYLGYYLDWTSFYIKSFFSKYNFLTFLIIFGIIIYSINIILNSYEYPIYQYVMNNNLSSISSLLLTIGGSLLGLSILSFSLIMVSMQITVDKLPNELFRKFNNDLVLKSYFVFMFLISISICFLSVIVNFKNFYIISLLFFALVMTMIAIIFLTYSRASLLINPIKQLNFMCEELKKTTDDYEKRYLRFANLIVSDEDVDFDIKRSIFLKKNDYIIDYYKKYIDYFISFSEVYSKSNDYKVSNEALIKLIFVNKLYVTIKGNNFFNDILFFDHPYSSDSLINHSLEKLRISLGMAVKKVDEPQIENILSTLKYLSFLYSQINYVNENNRKKHAKLAMSYLTKGINSALNLNQTDVVMEGVKFVGETLLLLMKEAALEDGCLIVNDLNDIAIRALSNNETYPAAQVVVNNLVNLLLFSLLKEDRSKSGLFRSISNSLSNITIQSFRLNDGTFNFKQKSVLTDYYSIGLSNTFIVALDNLVKKVNSEDESESNREILHSFYEWELETSKLQADILNFAIKNNSSMVHDIVSWNVLVANTFINITKSKSINNYLLTKLENGAINFISIFYCILEDKKHLFNINTTESLFNLGVDSNKMKLHRCFDKVIEIFIEIFLMSMKLENSYNVINESFLSLIGLLVNKNDNDKIDKFIDILIKNSEIIQGKNREKLDLCVRDIRDLIDEAYVPNNIIHNFIKECDKEKIEIILNKIFEVI